MKKTKVQLILDDIYGGGLEPKDYAAMIRKIYQALDDSFYEYPPDRNQKAILDQLLTLADKVELFYK